MKYEFRSLSMLGEMYDESGEEAGIKSGTWFRLASDYDALAAQCEVHKQDAMREISEANELAEKCDDLVAQLAEVTQERDDNFNAGCNIARQLGETKARLAETERDKEHLQRAVDRACQVMREDVLTQDLDGTTTARVNLFLATYGTPVSASLAQE